ncbi:MAG TPA: hypothetical protein VJA26_12355 [Gammaproteobacteria bacterium]|nr:hypothetical protein [Gammaproteobacteria bacterium]
MTKVTLLLGCMAMVATAVAQVGNQALPGSGLELQIVVETVVEVTGADGQPSTELVPVAAPLPGDEIVYTVTFTNVNAQMAENIRITNPIPAQVRYLADTAFGPGSEVLYSVDGGRTYGLPPELFVTAGDGSQRAAEAGDYTHIRWVLKSPLDAGAKGFARFRAVVR